MSQITPQLHPLWNAYPQLQADLASVLMRIQANLDVDDVQIEQALLTTFQNGGKLLRPAFAILMADFNPVANRDALLNLAASIEMLHGATLIHDDIIDDAPTRRHHPSVQAQLGKDIAVYAGDFLFAATFRMIADNVTDVATMRQATRYLDHILYGELCQRANHYRLDMTMAEYLNQIAGKTAALFELAIILGTSTTNADEVFISTAQSFGRNVGIAFQLLDDILDYTADADKLGKPVLHDVREGVYSAPLILALAHNPEIATLVSKGAELTDLELLALKTMVINSGAVDAAKDLAVTYTEQAWDDLDALPDAHTKNILMAISTELLARQN
ncbi:MAG: polyprenyl synthetase family protein [Lactobacillaceae bacterium]|jgi:heptaprenyl diphosphate synthase|nr:polyprenyl synthetase family protein [Lactobacillaceae bacterium]